VVSSVENNSLSGRSYRSGQSQNEEKDTRHLLLDLDLVDSGRDTRTSLMVRNIPNKYTQQMLLNELQENGHGPGIIDFFYLPIDFKNRCNRGYAFVNFVDFKDIIPFHTRYFGKHWRTFNSDKICDITYARIQGKQAMLKRFENSALMEKDDEYKPLVFVSDGPDKGNRLPFPDPNALINSTTRATI
jgi:RNA recognition motif 2